MTSFPSQCVQTTEAQAVLLRRRLVALKHLVEYVKAEKLAEGIREKITSELDETQLVLGLTQLYPR